MAETCSRYMHKIQYDMFALMIKSDCSLDRFHLHSCWRWGGGVEGGTYGCFKKMDLYHCLAFFPPVAIC
jgi:hypothetical protein